MAFRRYFHRGEKSEVLTEELEALDKKITLVRTACYNSNKKLQATFKDHGIQDKEKRMRKCPEHLLASQMLEAADQLSSESIMGQMYKLCGEAERNKSEMLIDAEMEIEGKVLSPLQTLVEQEIPNITKKKKQLSGLVADMDSARSKFHSAQDKYRDQPGGDVKIATAQNDMEDAQLKVEQCRDQLSTEMFNFSAKETENSNFLLDLIKIQADYHEKALKVLHDAIPKMTEASEQHNQVPVYGTDLEEHLRRTNREVATVIEGCVTILAEIGMKEEGLFRIAGGASKVKKVKAAFDAGHIPDMNEIRDVHCISGALKLYLRELPEPLLTFGLYQRWMDAAHQPHEERMQALWMLCDELPKPNKDNLRHLVKFLNKLSEHHEINKMTPSNIAIVIGPNLLWQQNAGQSVLTTSSQSAIVDSLITHADYFFPGEIDFGTSNTSDRSKTSEEDPFLVNEPPTHNSLHTSSSGSNLLVDLQTSESSSPRAPRRKDKKPAPLPPAQNSTGSLDRKQAAPTGSTSGSLDRKAQPPERPPPAEAGAAVDRKNNSHQFERPPTAERPVIVTTTDKPSDRPLVPDRPLAPPPVAPLKPQQLQQENQDTTL